MNFGEECEAAWKDKIRNKTEENSAIRVRC